MKNVNKPSTSIKSWAPDDRPREKLLSMGASSLSDSELLAILIQTGTRSKSAVDIAKDVLHAGKSNLYELGKLSLPVLQKINGIGKAKAITITAALELGRRRQSVLPSKKEVIHCAADIAGFLRSRLTDHPYEVFAVVFLNRANKVNHFEIISRGGITGTVADIRIIMQKALEQHATSIILCHNHPSGNLQPSQADHAITQKIRSAAQLFDIQLLDHIIVSEEGYYSFEDEK